MGTTTEEIADMHTEGTDVGASFTADPENAHVTVFVVLNQLRLIDSSDSELLLDGRDQGWSLEAGALKRIESLLKLLDLVNRLMQLDNCDVFLTSRLLSFDQAGGVVDAHDEASSDFGVESARVARLVDFEDFLDPGDDLVRARVRRLVQIDHTVLL